MHRALAPAHLGDVDQPLDAFLQLDEGAVVGDAHDLALEARPHWITLGRARPRVGHDLFHAEGHALARGIVLEHHHLDLVADLDRFRRMLQAAPRHVGDVQQSVEPAEIDESAVVGDVLHHALEDHALFEHLERLLLEFGALALDHGAARNHNVAARAVELEQLEAPALADVAVQVARRTDVDMRAGQKSRHTDIDLQAALDLAQDYTLDRHLVLERALELAPDLELLRLGVREGDRAVLSLGALEIDVNLVAFLDHGIALVVEELGERHLPFALIVDVDDHTVARDQEDRSGQYITRAGSLEALFHQ